MDLFNAVHEQMDMVRLPLVAVTVAVARRSNTPLVAILHWHGFRRASPLVLPGVGIPPRSIPGSAIQLTCAWQNTEAADEALPDVVWQFGIWDFERIEQRGCNVVDASTGGTLTCRQAFSDHEGASADEVLIDGAPDHAQSVQIAVSENYLRRLL